MTDAGNSSCVARALAKVLETLLDSGRFSVNTCRYADVFNDCWRMQSAVTAKADRTDIVVMDGHFAALGEHACNASAIAWIVVYALSNKAANGTRYLITGAELPPYLREVASLLRRAIAPHVVVGLRDETASGWVDVPDLLARLQEPVRPDVSARNRLERLLVHEFLAPEEHHKVSNFVSPMLLAATLKSAAIDVASIDDNPGVIAIRGQLRALGLLDENQFVDNKELADLRKKALKELSIAVESAQKRIMAARGSPDDPHPIAMHLVEDNKALWPILDAVLGQKCEPHASLSDQELAPWATADSILFLDMRLSSTDEGKAITQAPGFLYAFKLAPERPYMPIVTFSTTQQLKLPKTVKKESETSGIHNIITSFSKPSLAAQGTMNAEACIDSLKDLANAAVEAIMMIEQSRAMLAWNMAGASAIAKAKDDHFYLRLYDRRWLEVLVLPTTKPNGGESPAAVADESLYQDMELIREFAMRWATRPQIANALRVDLTEPQAGWVWALAVIRVWLASGHRDGLTSFASRLKAGLLTDYDAVGVVEGIPIHHLPGTAKDTVHDVLLWATGEELGDLSVAIKTILQHVCKQEA